jgi:hypothetical protein
MFAQDADQFGQYLPALLTTGIKKGRGHELLLGRGASA